MKNRKVLFLAPYPLSQAPSQRFRFEHYFSYEKEWGLNFTFQSFIDNYTWEILYKPGHIFRKFAGIIFGGTRRFFVLFTIWKFDYVFIHREAMPIGPPIIEWLISIVFRKKIIYDFDDSIWLPNTSEYNKIASGVKWHKKVSSICKWANKITVGNDYLAEFALKYNQNVVVIPTVVDTETSHNKIHQFDTEKLLSVGWTGTHSTILYLNKLIPTLQGIYQIRPFQLIVISDKAPEFSFPNLFFIQWNKVTEIEDLNRIDVGLMPLEDDLWSRGKCGFKAIQYMSLGIPAVVSDVGVNPKIVDDGVNGYVCEDYNKWKERLLFLLEHPENLHKMSESARRKIIDKYSVSATKDIFFNLFAK